jgi:transcriptional accessory protein Tex/SPT6
MGKVKTIKSIDLLLDNGFIQHEGFMQSSKGSKHRIYRVVHPDMIATVREVMPILPALPSETAKRLSKSCVFSKFDPEELDNPE